MGFNFPKSLIFYELKACQKRKQLKFFRRLSHFYPYNKISGCFLRVNQMKSNRIYIHKALYVFAIVIFIFSIYVLSKGSPLKGLALLYDYEKEDHERLGKIAPQSCSASGTVLDVTGQLVTVQGTSPSKINFVYIKGDLPAGPAPGKTVDVRGQFKNGLIYTDHIPITGDTPWASPVTAPQSRGLIDSVIFFFIACFL